MPFREQDIIRHLEGTRFIDVRMTFDALTSIFMSKADEYGIPLAFAQDELTRGSILNRTSDTMLILYNPNDANHCMKVGITVRCLGNTSVVSPFVLRYDKPLAGTSGSNFGSKMNDIVGGVQKKGLAGLIDLGEKAAASFFGDPRREEQRKDWEALVTNMVENIGE